VSLLSLISSAAQGRVQDKPLARNVSIGVPLAVAVDGSDLWIGHMNGEIRHVNLLDGSIEVIETSAPLEGIGQIIVEQPGVLLVVETFKHRISRLNTKDGAVSSIAGTGEPGFSGDGGPASLAQLATHHQFALDRVGNIFIADEENNRIRRIDKGSNIITTIAGNGNQDYEDKSGYALQIGLLLPEGIAVDKEGNIFLGDGWNDAPRLRQIDAKTGRVKTLLGPDQLRLPKNLDSKYEDPVTPALLMFNKNGNLVFSGDDQYLFELPKNGRSMHLLAGTNDGSTVDGVRALKREFTWLRGLSFDSAGNLYVSDFWGHKVLRIDAKTTVVTTVAGNGNSDIPIIE
jgi:sugar lactone lactonase YvrE